MAFDVFISYASKDKIVADAVCAKLESSAIRCWIAPRDIVAGTSYGEAIIEAIHGAKVMVLVFSSNANASGHIPKEVERAVSNGVAILPFRIEDVAPGKSLDSIQIVFEFRKDAGAVLPAVLVGADRTASVGAAVCVVAVTRCCHLTVGRHNFLQYKPPRIRSSAAINGSTTCRLPSTQTAPWSPVRSRRIGGWWTRRGARTRSRGL